MSASPLCLFFFVSGLTRPVLLLIAAFLSLPIRGCLLKSRTTHSSRDVVIPGLILSCGTDVAPRLPSAGTRRTFVLVFRIHPIVTPNSSGFTRLFRFFKITAYLILSESLITTASERARFGRSVLLFSSSDHSSSFLQAFGLFATGFLVLVSSGLAVDSLSRLRMSGVDLGAGCGGV